MNTYDLIIIGAGPAGLTAGLYAGRARLNTIIIEKASVGGRILMSEVIENFPGFPKGISTHELISRMEEQVKRVGVGIKPDEALDINYETKTVKTSGTVYSAKAIIIAAGAKPRRLNVPGETELTSKGVSYCATCDGPLYKGKNVVIVGGGNAVAEEALYLARFVKNVTIVHRRQDLRASAILQERLKENKKISFILNTIVTRITGDNRVEQVKIKNTIDNQETSIACDGVFVYVGYEPETGFLKGALRLDEKGFIVAAENLATSAPGIFACGDCCKKSLYQVITACADGAIAAESAHKFLTSGA